MNHNFLGKYAEFLACCLFVAKGYSILSTNYITGRGTHAGEIDFIAKKKNLIVFVEVKKRKSLEDASYAITEHQKQRITNGAKAFLKRHPAYEGYDCRFDAVLVKLPFKIEHLKNAWES